MEISAAKNFAGNYATISVARTQAPKDQTVATDLPAPKAVSQAGEMLQVNTSYRQVVSQEPLLKEQEEKREAIVQRDVVAEYQKDNETGDMVFKTINSRTGDVVHQIPSELQLKMRTYMEEAPGAGGYRSSNLNTKFDTRI